MMDLSNYYLHATGGHDGFKNKDNIIIKILKEGKINPSEENQNYSCSPENKVCLIDPRRCHDNNIGRLVPAFYQFALSGPTIALSRNISVESYPKIHIDEVRHTGEISIDKIQLITFPFYWDSAVYNSKHKIHELQIFRKNIEILSKDFSMLPLKEIYTGKDITLDCIDRQIEIYQKNMK